MGFLDYGLAAKAFADGFRQTYITDAEREKQRAEMQLQNLQVMGLLQEQQAQQNALEREAGYKRERGLLGDNPSIEQEIALQSKWYPEKGITNRINYTKNEEANKIKMEQFEQNMKHQIEMLNLKNDAASQLQAQKLQNVLDAIRLKASTPNVNVNLGGGFDNKLDRKLIEKTLTDLPSLKKDATNQASNIVRINEALTLVDSDGVTGKGGQVKAFIAPYAEALGINSQSLSDAQKFQLLTRAIVGPMRLDIIGPGPVSEWEQKLMQQISGGGGAAKDAAKTLLNYYKKAAQSKIENYNNAVNGVTSIYPNAGLIHKTIDVDEPKATTPNQGNRKPLSSFHR